MPATSPAEPRPAQSDPDPRADSAQPSRPAANRGTTPDGFRPRPTEALLLLRDYTAALPRHAEEWNWQLAARCRSEDPALFFQPDGERPSARQRRHRAAKAICAACPVTVECRRHSLVLPETFGIWGGLSEAERAKAIGLSRDHNRHSVEPVAEP